MEHGIAGTQKIHLMQFNYYGIPSLLQHAIFLNMYSYNNALIVLDCHLGLSEFICLLKF